MFEPDDYTTSQGALADFVQQLAEDFDFAYFLENMKRAEFPARFWKVLGEGGYLGILAPEEYGGAESSTEDLVVFIHNLARNGLASQQLLNHIFCCELVTRYGSDEQKKNQLPEMISGDLCALALMEHPEAMDLFDLEMRADRRGEAFDLCGTKRYVSGAGAASRMLVAARTRTAGAGDRKGGISLFVVSPQARGIEKTRQELSVRVTAEEDFVMITGDAFCDVAFDSVSVAREDLVGEEHLAGQYIDETSSLLFIMTAVTAIGWGENVLEKAVEYAKSRVIFEQPIGSYQAIQHPMVRARTELELAKLAITRAVSAYDRCEEQAVVYASIAKYAATEAAYAACDISLQAHGGYGFDRETGIITLWPLILLSRIVPLNNDVILERFAEAALELPAAAADRP